MEIPTESKKLVSINTEKVEVMEVERRKTSLGSCSTKSGSAEDSDDASRPSTGCVMSSRELNESHQELLWKSVRKVVKVFESFAQIKNIEGICSLSPDVNAKVIIEDEHHGKRFKKAQHGKRLCCTSSPSNSLKLHKYWTETFKELDFGPIKLKRVVMPSPGADNIAVDNVVYALANTMLAGTGLEYDTLFIMELKEHSFQGKEKAWLSGMMGGGRRNSAPVVEIKDLHWVIVESYFVKCIEHKSNDGELEARLKAYRAAVVASSPSLTLPSSLSSSGSSTPSWSNLSPKFTPQNPISMKALYPDPESAVMCSRGNVEFPSSTLTMNVNPGLCGVSPMRNGTILVRGQLGSGGVFTERCLWNASNVDMFKEFTLTREREWYSVQEFLCKFENGICLAQLSVVDNEMIPACPVLVVAGPNPTRTHVCSNPSLKVTSQIRLFDLFEPTATPTEYNSNTHTIQEYVNYESVEIRLFKFMRPEVEFADPIYLNQLVMNDLKVACKLLKRYSDLMSGREDGNLPRFGTGGERCVA